MRQAHVASRLDKLLIGNPAILYPLFALSVIALPTLRINTFLAATADPAIRI